MSIKIKLFLFLGLVIALTSGAIDAENETSEPEMERVLLPPWLAELDGSNLNIAASDGSKRSVKSEEWLKYGDLLALPQKISMYTQMNEGVQWVGGGVFNAQLKVDKDIQDPTYEIVLTHGWMKVWIRPTNYTGTLVINTPKVNLIARDAVFWVSLANAKTEVYVISGSVSCGTKECRADHYYQWTAGKQKEKSTFEEWTDETYEAKISKQFPSLVKLAERAQQVWIDEDSYSKYHDLRIENWRKTEEAKKKLKPKRKV